MQANSRNRLKYIRLAQLSDMCRLQIPSFVRYSHDLLGYPSSQDSMHLDAASGGLKVPP